MRELDCTRGLFFVARPVRLLVGVGDAWRETLVFERADFEAASVGRTKPGASTRRLDVSATTERSDRCVRFSMGDQSYAAKSGLDSTIGIVTEVLYPALTWTNRRLPGTFARAVAHCLVCGLRIALKGNSARRLYPRSP